MAITPLAHDPQVPTFVEVLVSFGNFGPDNSGSVTGTLYGPDDPTCSGPGIATDSGSPDFPFPLIVFLVGGDVEQAGVYHWTVSYSGDQFNPPEIIECGAELFLDRANSTVATAASPGGPLGTAVRDTATVSGTSVVTGNVTFRLFSDPACTVQVFTSTRPLVNNRATSGDFTPGALGTYRWTAAYNGDANNKPVTSPCNAPGESVVVKPNPTIVTTASAGTLLGGPVFDKATLSGGSSPTGTMTFRLYGDAACANQVFTSTNAVVGGAATSGVFTPTATGTYRWTATYSGDANNNAASSPCNAPNESVTIRPFAPPPCTRSLTGEVLGPVTVNAGETVCVTDARVQGAVAVNPGGALTVLSSRLLNGVTANGPAFFSVCDTSVAAPSGNLAQGVVVTNATAPIRIGDPVNGCALNRVAGDVRASGNQMGVTLGANQVSRHVTLSANTIGNVLVRANQLSGTLACTSNNPAPSNAGQPNTAAAKTGQCAGL